MMTTMTESRNMVAILQIIAWQRHATLVYCVLLWYWTSLLWSIDTCQNKVSADQYHVTISWAQVYSSLRSRIFLSWPLTKCWFSIRSRAHVRLICWNQGRNVRKQVTTSPGLKLIWIITFFLLYKCFCCFILCIWWLWNSKQKSNNKQKTSL